METSPRVTLSQAARHFGVGESTLWRRVARGILKRDENKRVSLEDAEKALLIRWPPGARLDLLGSHLSALKPKVQRELRKSLRESQKRRTDKTALTGVAKKPTIEDIADKFETWLQATGGKTGLLARPKIEQQKLCAHLVLMKNVYEMLLSSICGKP